MALSTQYCGTSDVILALGGTGGRLDIGTSGTNAIHPTAVGSLIVWASDFVDYQLGALVGTGGFGTNAIGTSAVPAMIVQVTAKLAAAEVIKTLLSSRAPNASDWAKEKTDEAMAILDAISSGSKPLPGASVGESDLPRASNLTYRIRAESVAFNGTEIALLQFERALPGGIVVYSTHVSGGTVFTKDVDYKFFAWNTGTSPQNAAALQNIGTRIPANATVLIDYEVFTDHVFGNPTDHKASAGGGALMKPMVPSFAKELSSDLSGYR